MGVERSPSARASGSAPTPPRPSPVPAPMAPSPTHPITTASCCRRASAPGSSHARASCVPGTGYTWHSKPDGGACFASPEGGWVYASNSEEIPGGVVARCASTAERGHRRRLPHPLGHAGELLGGPTPWGTWLSCEEFDGGRVWECDPTRPSQGVSRPALGTFAHEAVAVDPEGRRLYLTEDRPNGRFYRFTPSAWPSLSGGILEAARSPADAFVGGGELGPGSPGCCPRPRGRPRPPRRSTAARAAGTTRHRLLHHQGQQPRVGLHGGQLAPARSSTTMTSTRTRR